MKKVFIDGKAGTTGLRIFERLGDRADIELITLTEEQRKDTAARKAALNAADIAFLCLPDPAAIEAVSLIDNPNTVVIDTSTAHRTSPDWTYGFPELSSSHEAAIKSSKRIAVPGCHASGFIALVYPLVEAGILPADALLTCHSLTGYSGGGKKMIADYESDDRDALLGAPRQYGLTQQHKHLKEMKAITGIDNAPVFCPIVADFYSGMEVTVPLFKSQLCDGKTANDIIQAYKNKYTGPLVTYCDSADTDGFLSAAALSGKDSMKITVGGNEDRIILLAVYDNLGKGASGAAVECLNIVMGNEKTFGLEI
ncbi:MAG: N-acetyl-gamma-glutamyl-phosphate reductase [Clostridia bacterium]|nr:N-acetyl-gamma-glutamyl-phosphate reductase [Clostridia bacterium]